MLGGSTSYLDQSSKALAWIESPDPWGNTVCSVFSCADECHRAGISNPRSLCGWSSLKNKCVKSAVTSAAELAINACSNFTDAELNAALVAASSRTENAEIDFSTAGADDSGDLCTLASKRRICGIADLWRDERPAVEEFGTGHTEVIFNREAVSVINRHDPKTYVRTSDPSGHGI